ncbi:MAG: hypothetical protein ACI8W8_002971 [Rhodothermales bacterium]
MSNDVRNFYFESFTYFRTLGVTSLVAQVDFALPVGRCIPGLALAHGVSRTLLIAVWGIYHERLTCYHNGLEQRRTGFEGKGVIRDLLA